MCTRQCIAMPGNDDAAAVVVVVVVAVTQHPRGGLFRPPTRNISRFVRRTTPPPQRPNSLQFRSRNYMRRNGWHLAGDARAMCTVAGKYNKREITAGCFVALRASRGLEGIFDTAGSHISNCIAQWNEVNNKPSIANNSCAIRSFDDICSVNQLLTNCFLYMYIHEEIRYINVCIILAKFFNVYYLTYYYKLSAKY